MWQELVLDFLTGVYRKEIPATSAEVCVCVVPLQPSLYTDALVKLRTLARFCACLNSVLPLPPNLLVCNSFERHKNTLVSLMSAADACLLCCKDIIAVGGREREGEINMKIVK